MTQKNKKTLKAVETYDAESAELIKDMSDVNPEIIRASQVAGVKDAAENLVFARQLETISSRLYDVQYAELKGRTMVPFTSEAGPNTMFLTYRLWDGVTLAKVVTNYATDFPLVTASAREMTIRFYDFGNSYGYSIQDMQIAAACNVPLSDKYAQLARAGHEQAIDDAVAVGVAELGTFGLANHPNVTLESLPTGSWSSATGEQILADLNYLITNQWANTLEIHKANTILMGTRAFRLLSTKLLNTGNASNVSVLEAFKAMNPGVEVASWTRLNTADAAGDSSRIICYKKDPNVLEFAMGQEFQVYPAEQRGLQLTHVCKSRFAGLILHIPLAVSYADNHGI